MKFNTYFLLVISLALVGCASDFTKEEHETKSTEERRTKGMEKFLGEDTLSFGGPKKREQEDTGLGVNSHLWRATLDTIAFMPLTSADPFGGVIITDWYSPSQTPKERLKMNVYILDRQLRSDGIKVSLFRQERDSAGAWVDREVDPQTSKDIENAILARARHFRSQATR